MDTLTFPVTVTQQSHAAVSMDTYQITTAPMVTQVQTRTWTLERETNETGCICIVYSNQTENHMKPGRLSVCLRQVVVSLEEVEDEGLLMSWTLSKQPSFTLTVSPCKLHRQVSSPETNNDDLTLCVSVALRPGLSFSLQSETKKHVMQIDP